MEAAKEAKKAWTKEPEIFGPSKEGAEMTAGIQNKRDGTEGRLAEEDGLLLRHHLPGAMS